MTSLGRPRRVLGIGDLHADPRQSEYQKDRYDWIGQHLAQGDFDDVVFIGDFLTMDSLNSHDKDDTLKGRLKPSFEEDMSDGRATAHRLLSPFKQRIDKARRLHLARPKIPHIHAVMGNHDWARATRYENDHPPMKNQLLPQIIDLFKGCNIIPYKEYLNLDGVLFTHVPMSAMGQPIGGANVSQAIALHSNVDVVHGHDHKFQVINRAKIGGDRVTVIDLSCALPEGHVEDYAKHSMNAWSYGITELDIIDKHVYLSRYITMRQLEHMYAI